METINQQVCSGDVWGWLAMGGLYLFVVFMAMGTSGMFERKIPDLGTMYDIKAEK